MKRFLGENFQRVQGGGGFLFYYLLSIFTNIYYLIILWMERVSEFSCLKIRR